MAVKLRLQRKGRKKAPYYQIVAADARSPRDGKYIERIGSYNPLTIPATIDIDTERAFYWITMGAQPSDTVRAILRLKGVMYWKHLQRGIVKGVHTEEEAKEKLRLWLEAKEAKTAQSVAKEEERKRAWLKEMDGTPGKIAQLRKEDHGAQEEFVAAEGSDAPTADVVVEETVAVDAPTGDVVVEETVVIDTPTEEVIVDTVVEETPTEEVIVETVVDATADEVVVEQTVTVEEPVVEEEVLEVIVPEAPEMVVGIDVDGDGTADAIGVVDDVDVPQPVEEVEKPEAIVEEVVVAETPEPEVVEETIVVTEPVATGKPDDLKKIEGIGPKISEIMNGAGIMTFADMSKKSPEELKTILEGAGSRYRMHDPTTWPKQAEFAAAGKWDELKKWQDELDGGRA